MGMRSYFSWTLYNKLVVNRSLIHIAQKGVGTAVRDLLQIIAIPMRNNVTLPHRYQGTKLFIIVLWVYIIDRPVHTWTTVDSKHNGIIFIVFNIIIRYCVFIMLYTYSRSIQHVSLYFAHHLYYAGRVNNRC